MLNNVPNKIFESLKLWRVPFIKIYYWFVCDFLVIKMNKTKKQIILHHFIFQLKLLVSLNYVFSAQQFVPLFFLSNVSETITNFLQLQYTLKMNNHIFQYGIQLCHSNFILYHLNLVKIGNYYIQIFKVKNK